MAHICHLKKIVAEMHPLGYFKPIDTKACVSDNCIDLFVFSFSVKYTNRLILLKQPYIGPKSIIFEVISVISVVISVISVNRRTGAYLVIVRSLCVLCAPYTGRESLYQHRGRLSSPYNFLPQFFYPFLSVWRTFTLSGKVWPQLQKWTMFHSVFSWTYELN